MESDHGTKSNCCVVDITSKQLEFCKDKGKLNNRCRKDQGITKMNIKLEKLRAGWFGGIFWLNFDFDAHPNIHAIR